MYLYFPDQNLAAGGVKPCRHSHGPEEHMLPE